MADPGIIYIIRRHKGYPDLSHGAEALAMSGNQLAPIHQGSGHRCRIGRGRHTECAWYIGPPPLLPER